MSAPLTDTEIRNSESGYLAFERAYGLNPFDPLMSLLRVVILAADDPRPQILRFLNDCLCQTCKGDGVLEDEEGHDVACYRCHGKGAAKPKRIR